MVIYSQGDADLSVQPPSVVMLTADRQIDRRILLEADSLESAGWNVTILAMPVDGGMVDSDCRVVRINQSDGGVTTRENFALTAYSWFRCHLPMNGRLMKLLKALAWRYFVDQESFFIKLFSDAVSRYCPDVFVAHDLPMLAVARKAAEGCGAKLVYDSHELYCEQEFSNREKRRWAEIEAKHIQSCDAVITINPSIANELEKRYLLGQVNVVYNTERTGGATEQHRYFHNAFKLNESCKVLLFQGGLSAGRHIESLVKAMGYVKNSAVHLVVLGDGQLVSRLQVLIETEALLGRVHLHPAVSQQELISYTASADAGIIPYQATCLNNYYCTPNKLFEFIAAGIPMLVSDLPEIRRIVSLYKVGLIRNLSSIEQLAMSVDEFFSDDARLQTWKGNVVSARKQVCWECESEKVVSIFEALR